jgi:hypothetical protein
LNTKNCKIRGHNSIARIKKKKKSKRERWPNYQRAELNCKKQNCGQTKSKNIILQLSEK